MAKLLISVTHLTALGHPACEMAAGAAGMEDLPMQVSIAVNPIIALRGTVSRVRATPLPARFWRILVDARRGRLERRIEEHLRWLDHDGVSEDYRKAKRG